MAFKCGETWELTDYQLVKEREAGTTSGHNHTQAEKGGADSKNREKTPPPLGCHELLTNTFAKEINSGSILISTKNTEEKKKALIINSIIVYGVIMESFQFLQLCHQPPAYTDLFFLQYLLQ